MNNGIRTKALPLTAGIVRSLRAGDQVMLDGELLTARDAAHKRLAEALARGETLPVELRGATVYYTGPTPARPGRVIGSAGPTTAGRMDAWTEPLLRAGVLGMIGKGARSPAIAQALVQHGAVYLAAAGGAGAYLADRITTCAVAAYPELHSEAIHRLTVHQFPVIVAQDAHGGSIFARAARPAPG